MKYLAQFKIPGQTGTSEQIPIPSAVPKGLQGGLSESGKSFLEAGFNLLFIVAAMLAIIVIILSGIQWTASSGDPGKIAAARKRIIFAIIGLCTAAFAFFIFSLLTQTLGIKPTG